MSKASDFNTYLSSLGSTDNIFDKHADEDGLVTAIADAVLGFRGSDTWDASSIADGDEEAKEVACTGAVLGMMAQASLSLDVADLVINAAVTEADVVTVVLANNTGGAVDLASATVKVRAQY